MTAWAIQALVICVVVVAVVGFTRGPVHDTGVYGWRQPFVFCVGVLFALAGPLLLVLAYHDKAWCLRALAVTTIGPPIWFFVEYFYLVDHALLRNRKELFDAFKHAQDSTAKVWLGAVAFLLVLYRWHSG